MSKHVISEPISSAPRYYVDIQFPSTPSRLIDLTAYFSKEGLFNKNNAGSIVEEIEQAMKDHAYSSIDCLRFCGQEVSVELFPSHWVDLAVNNMEEDFIKEILTHWRINQKMLDAGAILSGYHDDVSTAGYTRRHQPTQRLRLSADIELHDGFRERGAVSLNLAVYCDDFGNGDAFCYAHLFLGDANAPCKRELVSTQRIISTAKPGLIDETCEDHLIEMALTAFEDVVAPHARQKLISDLLKEHAARMLRTLNDGAETGKSYAFSKGFDEFRAFLEANILKRAVRAPECAAPGL